MNLVRTRSALLELLFLTRNNLFNQLWINRHRLPQHRCSFPVQGLRGCSWFPRGLIDIFSLPALSVPDSIWKEQIIGHLFANCKHIRHYFCEFRNLARGILACLITNEASSD